MNTRTTQRLFWLALSILALTALLLLREDYTRLTQRVELPEKLEHTIYHALIAFFISEIIKLAIFLTYRPQNKRSRDNFTIGIGHLSKVIYGMMAIAIVLSVFNITLREAMATLSLVAAALVLITKDYISNLINGMYMTFARIINIGDQVAIDKLKGKIIDITLTNVHLLNDDDDIVYIPNNKVFSSDIINYTRRDLKKSSIEFEVKPELAPDLDILERQCIAMLEPFARDIQPDSYALKTTAVKMDALHLKFQYVLHQPLNKELDKKVRRHFTRNIVKYLYAT